LNKISTQDLLSNSSTAGFTEAFTINNKIVSFQVGAKCTSSTGTALVSFWVSNDNVNYVVASIFNCSLSTTYTMSSVQVNCFWKYIKAEIESITSGIGATITATIGVEV
jgi:hypothetical protein